MSVIAYDPSEARKGTRLPQNVIDAGRPLNGLEEITGSDLLLSPLSLPLKPLTDDTSLRLLRRHVEAGLLIQRKSGRDAVSSIPNYPAIQQRMMEWTCYPLLLTVGQYGSNRESKVLVDGTETEWSQNAYSAAIDWWMLRGGLYQNLSRDGQVLQYLNLWLDRLASDEWNDSKEKHVILSRPPKQVLGKPDWLSVVMSLGVGIGSAKVEWFHNNFSNLAEFLCFFSDYSPSKIAKGNGIGKSNFRKVRSLLGLSDDEVLVKKLKEHK